MKTLKLSVLVTYVNSVSSIVLIVVSLNLLTASFIFIKSVNMIHTLKVTAASSEEEGPRSGDKVTT